MACAFTAVNLPLKPITLHSQTMVGNKQLNKEILQAIDSCCDSWCIHKRTGLGHRVLSIARPRPRVACSSFLDSLMCHSGINCWHVTSNLTLGLLTSAVIILVSLVYCISIRIFQCIMIFDMRFHSKRPTSAETSIWFKNWDILGPGFKTAWGVVCPKKFNRRRRIAQDWGYHNRNFYLIVCKFFRIWKSPLWKVFFTAVNLPLGKSFCIWIVATLESVLISKFCTL